MMNTREGPEHGVGVHPILIELFDALERDSLSWCILRGETDLLAPAGDVDLLVAPAALRRVSSIVKHRGFVRLPAWGYGSHVFFVMYDPRTDAWIKLDVVTELAFGPRFSLATGAETEFLARRQFVAGIPVPADADFFWALLLHELLDKAEVRAPDARRLEQLVGATSDGPLARFVDSICPVGWTAGRIANEVRCGNWLVLTDLAPRLANTWRGRRGDGRRRIASYTLWRSLGKFISLMKARGLRVAVLGPDGVGKSSVTAGIEKRFYFPTVRVYMGPYRGRSDSAARLGIPGVGLAVRLIRQWARWLKASYHSRRGRLVLFDRFSYDALLPGASPRTRRSRVGQWLLAHATPSPDLVILLDAPAELLLSRREGHDLILLDKHRRAYRDLVSRLSKGYVVDASRDLEHVRCEVTTAIWREYARRWR